MALPTQNLFFRAVAGVSNYQTTDTSTPATANNDPVGRVEDQSGNANHIIQATTSKKFTLKTAIKNGQSVWYLDGGDVLQNGTLANWKFLHDGSAYTAMAVCYVEDSNPDAALGIFGTNGGSSAQIGASLFYDDRSSQSREDKGIHFVTRGVVGEPVVVNEPGLSNCWDSQTWVIVIVRFQYNRTGNDSRLLMLEDGDHGFLEGSDSGYAPSSSNPSYAFDVGSRGNEATPFKGYIAEVNIWDAWINDVAYEDAVQYAIDRYGIDTRYFYESNRGTVQQDGSYYESFPTIDRDKNDAIWVCYKKGTAHWNDPGSKVVVKKSTDEGVTWGSEQDVFTSADNTDGTYNWSSGTILQMPENNALILIAHESNNNDAIVKTFYKTYNFLTGTWGGKTEITSTYLDGGYFRMLYRGSERITYDDNGTTKILMTAWGYRSGQSTRTLTVMESPVDSVNFVHKSVVGANEENLIEPSMCRIGTSTIRLVCRNTSNPANNGQQFISTDNGATWGSQTSLGEAIQAPSLGRLEDGDVGTTIMTYRKTNAAASVYSFSFRESYDDSAWGVSRIIDDYTGGAYGYGDGGYSDLVVNSSGDGFICVWYTYSGNCYIRDLDLDSWVGLTEPEWDTDGDTPATPTWLLPAISGTTNGQTALLVEIKFTNELKRLSINYWNLEHQWKGKIINFDINYFLSHNTGGYWAPNFGDITIASDVLDVTTENPPKRTGLMTLKLTDVNEQSAITLAKDLRLYLYNYGAATGEITYSVYGNRYPSTMSGDHTWTNEQLQNVFFWACENKLNLSLDSGKSRGEDVNVNFTFEGDQLTIEFLSEIAAYYTHFFYIDDEKNTLYLSDMETAIKTEQYKRPRNIIINAGLDQTGPIASIKSGDYIITSDFEYGETQTQTAYNTIQSDIETNLYRMINIQNKHGFYITIPLTTTIINPADLIYFEDDLNFNTICKGQFFVRQIRYDFINSEQTLIGEGNYV